MGQVLLSEIVADAGEVLPVFFDRDRHPSEGELAEFIWKPPMAEMNGWDSHPSELMHSYLVVGSVSKPKVSAIANQPAAMRDDLDKWAVEFQLNVFGRMAFLASCSRNNADLGPRSPCAYFLAEEESRWAGLAKVDGYLYLKGNRYEEHIEMILEPVAGSLTSVFQRCDTPGRSEIEVGRRTLTPKETSLVMSILAAADPFVDPADNYLVAE